MQDLTRLSEAERRALVQRAVELAATHFSGEGFNCAESVLQAIAEIAGLALPDAVRKIATPFGGGIGRTGCVCGGISGGVMALGLAFGRTTPDLEQRKVAYSHAERLWRRFVERTGSEDCRELNPGFDHPDHRTVCARYVAIGAELAAEEILGLGN